MLQIAAAVSFCIVRRKSDGHKRNFSVFDFIWCQSLQAITGFAGTLISMPPTMKLIGVDEAKALLNAIAQISSLMIVITGFRHINWKEFLRCLC